MNQYAQYNFSQANDAAIKAGSDWETRVSVKDPEGLPKNLAGYTGTMQIRERPNGTLLAAVTVALSPLDGVIELRLTAAQTAALRAQHGTYDLVLSSEIETVCLMTGSVEIIPLTTRSEA